MDVSTKPSLPLVVQLGFAGSRHLLNRAKHPGVNEAEFLAKVQAHLSKRLETLPGVLGLSKQHFFCGISQIAIGADTLFSRVCQEKGIPQRVFLPQHREEFLNATGSDGKPDFSAEEKQIAREILASPHVINERVVSDAVERGNRFEDANLEIVRVSDVLLCVVRDETENKAGGSHDLIARAASRKKPVLVIMTAVNNGQPEFHEEWLYKEHFTLPTLPMVLSAVSIAPIAHAEKRQSGAEVSATDCTIVANADLPTAASYCEALKSAASPEARRYSILFKRLALVIIGTHILATVCAVTALILHEYSLLPWLLGAELVLLATGFGTHQYFHRSEAAHNWVVTRLAAEVTRSVLNVGQFHVYLEYFFLLPFPEFLSPLLGTINVLHLRSTREARGRSWKPIREIYVQNRLLGQVNYYQQQFAIAKRHLRLAQRIFLSFSLTACAATLTKLLVAEGLIPLPSNITGSICGALAIVLPALAVATLSLAAAFDLEARYHTFKEMHSFLIGQIERFTEAKSEREFSKLLLETESRLLDETVSWYSRGAFRVVA